MARVEVLNDDDDVEPVQEEYSKEEEEMWTEHWVFNQSVLADQECGPDDWIIDSGATHHISCVKSCFASLRWLEKPVSIFFGRDSRLQVKQQGTVSLRVNVDGDIRDVEIEDVYFVPGFGANLFSEGMSLRYPGRMAQTTSTSWRLMRTASDQNIPLLTGHRRGNLYYLDVKGGAVASRSCVSDQETPVANRVVTAPNVDQQKSQKSSVDHVHWSDEHDAISGSDEGTTIDVEQLSCVIVHLGHQQRGAGVSVKDTGIDMEPKPRINVNLWHQRLGHLNKADVRRLYNESMVTGMHVHARAGSTARPVGSLCSACVLAKSTRAPVSRGRHTITRGGGVMAAGVQPGDMCVTDVVGPMRVQSPSGCRFSVKFTDVATRFSVEQPIRRKSDVLQVFKVHDVAVEVQRGRRMKALHSDNGGEYFSHAFNGYLETRGIRRSATSAGTPEHNPISERKNRTHHEMTMAMMFQSGFPAALWAELRCTACFLDNMCPVTDLPCTPFEGWHGRRPDVSRLRVIGCLAYVHVKKLRAPQASTKGKDVLVAGL